MAKTWRPAMWLVLSVFLFGFVGVPGRLKRAFQALDIYDYFKAKELFCKSLKRDSVPAAYGLSVIYSRDDNPFFNPDSAFKYIGIARANYSATSADDRADYSVLGVDSLAVWSQVSTVDSLIFSRVQAHPSVSAYGDFIRKHLTPVYRRKATMARDSLAFDNAQDLNTSEAYWNFYKNHPEATQRDEAYKRYHQRLYREKTASGTTAAYQKFVVDYPDSPYRSDAEYRIYQQSTAADTPEAYAEFILDNPGNEHLDEAWRKLYVLETREMTQQSITAFAANYPDYPFPEQLERDFANAGTRFYPFEIDGKWGYIDEDGRVRIAAEYDWNEPFSEGLAVVGRGDKVGFVDKTGKLIAPLEFEEASAFKNGFATVEKEGQYGVVNRLGNWVLQPVYDDVGEYSEGYFYVSSKGLYGYMDEQGRVAIPLAYQDATDFENDLAVVQSNGKKALIDRAGELLTEFCYDWIERFPRGHLPARVRVDGRFGLIDRTGTPVCDTLYAAIGDFGDGLALASNGDKYGFVNAQGDTAIAFDYTYRGEALTRSRFVDGYAPVFQKDKMGIIDTSGAKFYPAIFEDLGRYDTHPIPVKKRGKWGYADDRVNLVIPYRYSDAKNFHRDFAIAAREGLYGLLDTAGTAVLDFKFTGLTFVDTLPLLIATNDTAVGLIDVHGEVLVPLVYSRIESVDSRVLRFVDAHGAWHYYNFRRKAFLREPRSDEAERK